MESTRQNRNRGFWKIAFLTAALLGALGGEHLHAQMLDDYHAVVYLAGRRTDGHIQSLVNRQSRGTEAVVLTQESVDLRFLIRRDKKEYSTLFHAEEKEDGTLRNFSWHFTYDQKRGRHTGIVRPGGLEVTTDVKGVRSVRTWPLQGRLLGPWAVEKMLREKPFEKGVVVEVLTLAFQQGMPAVFRYVGKGRETLALPRAKGSFYRVEVQSKALEHPYTQWRDEKGLLVCASFAMDKVEIMTYTVTANEVIQSTPDFPPLPDFAPTPVNLTGDEDFSADMIWRITGPGLDGLSLEAPAQTVSNRGTGFVVVSVSATRDEPKGVRPYAPRDDLMPYLRQTVMVRDLFDKRKLERMEELLHGERSAWKAAVRIAVDISRHFEDGPWDSAFLPSSRYETMKSLSPWGRALLLVSRCRAAGIPARMVAGVRIAQSLASPALWVEVFGESWAALDIETVKSNYIRLARIPLDEEAGARVRMFLTTFAKLRFAKYKP